MADSFKFPEDVPILTDGVVTLRPHALSDVDAMVEQCRDPESITWTRVPVPYTREHAVRYITEVVPAAWRNRTELNFAIEGVHRDGVRRFSGSVSLRIRENQSAEIIGGMHPAGRGQGFFYRGLRLVLDWGFTQPEIDVVIANVNARNWASRRAIWALGFTFAGTLERFMPVRDGRTDIWFGTLRADDGPEPKTAWHVPPALEAGRLRLRPYRDSDAERIDGENTVRRYQEVCASGEQFVWCVADLETDEPVGHIQLSELDGPDPTSAEVSYFVRPERHGHEVLPDAVRVVADWALRPAPDGGLGKRRLSLTAAASEKTTRYAAEQAGFQHIATEPAAAAVGDAEFEDLLRYHRLAPDWHEHALEQG